VILSVSSWENEGGAVCVAHLEESVVERDCRYTWWRISALSSATRDAGGNNNILTKLINALSHKKKGISRLEEHRNEKRGERS